MKFTYQLQWVDAGAEKRQAAKSNLIKTNFKEITLFYIPSFGFGSANYDYIECAHDSRSLSLILIVTHLKERIK